MTNYEFAAAWARPRHAGVLEADMYASPGWFEYGCVAVGICMIVILSQLTVAVGTSPPRVGNSGFVAAGMSPPKIRTGITIVVCGGLAWPLASPRGGAVGRGKLCKFAAAVGSSLKG